MQGIHEWFLLIDNYGVSLLQAGNTDSNFIYPAIPTICQEDQQVRDKVGSLFSPYIFQQITPSEMWNTCVSVCLCMVGIKLSVLSTLSKFLHWVTSKGQKCRNSMTSPHHGLPTREGSCWLPTLLLSQAISLHIFNYWGPEVYIALLQTSGIQKCCLVQWASKALTAARRKMFQYKQTSWKPRAAKMQWLLLWPGPPDSPRCELLLSKYLPKERHLVTMTLCKSAEILCGSFLSRMAQLNSMEHRT